jgi:molecular chaperone GrpE
MSTRVRVPIRVRPAYVSEPASLAGAPDVVEATPLVMDRETPSVDPMHSTTPEVKRQKQGVRDDAREPREEESLDMWRDRAQRLQAEMDNFRKRQQRLADERIAVDRERLLRAFLGVADDLERALNTDGANVESLRQGVELTYQAMNKLLEKEGAKPIQAQGQPFDPLRHEAVGAVPHQHTDTEPDTVVQVVQTGYQLEDRLLRPARVIVAT